MVSKVNSLQDKVALITGGARRIGAQIAVRLHDEGMRIVVHCHRSGDEAEALVDKLNAQRPQSAFVCACDLLNSDSLRDFADTAVSRWQRLDVLINNASTFFPTPVAETAKTDWDKIMDVHTKAPFFLTQALMDELTRREGCIVNVTDIHADRPLKGYPVYSVAKAGMVMLTKALARELAPAVRCNAVAPGAILWPEADHYEDRHREIIARTALKREGNPEEIAKAVVYLVRDADYVTGQTVCVDGGRTLSN